MQKFVDFFLNTRLLKGPSCTELEDKKKEAASITQPITYLNDP